MKSDDAAKQETSFEQWGVSPPSSFSCNTI